MHLKRSTLLLVTLLIPLAAIAAPAQAPVEPPTHAAQPAREPAPVPGQPIHPSPFDTQQPAEPPTYEFALGKMLLTLLGLIILILLTVWMLRKLGGGKGGSGSGHAIKVLEKRPLSQKSMLYLVEVQGKQVLIAESQVEVRRLADIELLPND